MTTSQKITKKKFMTKHTHVMISKKFHKDLKKAQKIHKHELSLGALLVELCNPKLANRLKK